MPAWKAASIVAALSFVNFNVATCRSPGSDAGGEPAASAESKVVELPGVDTASLTVREKKQWSEYVSELLSPCPEQPVSIAQCVTESRACELCRPAAELIAKQVRQGRSRAQVETAYRLRFAPESVKSIDIAGSPAKGAKDPTVVIVEWADFECPFCAMASPVLDETVKKYPEHVQLVFKNYPLSSHEHAEGAARAAVAASKQGKFWEMHHALFENQDTGLDRKNLERLAKDIGLDPKQFAADLESEEAADAVSRDRKQAEKLGLRGTPMIYINGRHFEIELFNLVEDLGPWIELEIEHRTGKKVTAKAVEAAATGSAPPASDAPGAPAPAPGGSAPAPAGSSAPANGSSPAPSSAPSP